MRTSIARAARAPVLAIALTLAFPLAAAAQTPARANGTGAPPPRETPASTLPRVDDVTVIGAVRTRPAVVVNLTGLSSDEPLTPSERARAERRLQLLPTASKSALRYVPAEDGGAEMHAIIEEKSLLPLDWMDWGGIGARVILKEELRIDVGGPLGLGELWSVAWRWENHRPRFLAGVAMPAPGPLPGVVSLDALIEEQTYASAPANAPDGAFRERRRRAIVSFTDWATSQVRWRAGAGVDRIGGQQHVTIEGALDVRLLEDLLAPGGYVATWRPVGAATPFAVADLSLAWRTSRATLPPLYGLLGVAMTSNDAPLGVWPAAGTGGSGRGALLRAHPLHEHGVITSENFARRLMYFTIEHQRPVPFGPSGKTAVVAFLDAGRAWGGLPGRPRRVNVDIGTGVRFATGSGTIRMDLGFGLRDQQWAVSAGWADAWPWR